jgi:type III restriction enzyme
MQLKNYQENAIEELLEKAKRLLGRTGEKKLKFKSPTGSGKTITMAEFLKQLVDDREVRLSLCFIWTAPRQLHIQSKGKLDKYYEETRALKCSFFEDLDDRRIDEKEILFFNWESINREDNIYIRDNEQEFNLSNVLERTKEAGREIVLIIDEAHHHAESDISQGLIQMMGPKLTIEVSATPKMENPDEFVNVPIEDVKAEGMIKKAVILNEEFVNMVEQGKITSALSKSSEELVIDAGLKKRKALLKAFTEQETDINPLLLIQLPDRIGQLEDTMKDLVIRILKDKYHISTENEKLAIWLSGEHVNKEDVEKNNSPVEVLIFKQAIALGWDCPRAQILVLFRQWHKPEFSIQTIGRIMRMPEPDKGHYNNEILNFSYVYTNLSNIEVKEDISGGYVIIYTNKRKKDYKPLDLVSCHSVRHREKTRLTPLFIEIFLQLAKESDLKKKIDIKDKKLDLSVVNNWKMENIDVSAGVTIVGDDKISSSEQDRQKIFDYFAREHLSPFYPEDRSVGRVKESIYKFFEHTFDMKRGQDEDEMIQIVLSEKNIQHFVNIIDKAKDEYQKKVIEREPEIAFDENWNIPIRITYSENAIVNEVNLSIMEPFYITEVWRPEQEFIKFLERSRNIEWWFKNGKQDATYFAVPYNDGIDKPFYVDFIVKFKDGKIGLFDTKAGITIRDAVPKIDGLYKYMQSENKKGKKFWGGIITNTDTQHYRGRWIYFDKPAKNFKENDFSNWETLEL